jgi:EKC/KEOPS complex subunit CGI121/TPRKB
MILRLPHLEDHAVYVALYTGVKNSTFLKEQLLQGNSDFEYAFLDASSVNLH